MPKITFDDIRKGAKLLKPGAGPMAGTVIGPTEPKTGAAGIADQMAGFRGLLEEFNKLAKDPMIKQIGAQLGLFQGGPQGGPQLGAGQAKGGNPPPAQLDLSQKEQLRSLARAMAAEFLEFLCDGGYGDWTVDALYNQLKAVKIRDVQGLFK